jgi:hypothetical protein
MKTVAVFEIPEVEIEVTKVTPYGSEGKAVIIGTMGEGGILDLYLPTVVANGFAPRVGDHCMVKLLVFGQYEKRVDIASIRPMAPSAKGG